MKQIIAFFAAAAILCTFTPGCKSKTATDAAQADSTVRAVSAAVVYINMDSLVVHYDMYNELSKTFRDKQSKVEAGVNARGKSLEKDLMSYQEKVQKGLVTRLQAQTLEEELTKKQQEFMQYREREVSLLSEEEQVMLNRIHYSIVDYLKEFNADQRYGMIISTNTAGPVLNADPSLDITKAVIEGINKYYAANKDKK